MISSQLSAHRVQSYKYGALENAAVGLLIKALAAEYLGILLLVPIDATSQIPKVSII
jgi:hypothetical protein